MLVFDKNEILFFSEKENPYFEKVLKFRNLWESGAEEFVIKTSGSTGIPKEIKLARKHMITSANLTGKTFGLKKGDLAFCCLNVEYIAGMMMLVRGFELGLKMIVVEPKSSYQFSDIGVQLKEINLKFENIKFFAFVPLQLQTILEDEQNNSTLQLLSESTFILGGAAVGESLLEKIQNLDIPIYATYGMTETITHIAIKRLNAKEKQNYFETLEGVEIEQDERKCLKIKSQITDNQWIITNDVVEIYQGQFFDLVGRIDNVINSGGVKIQLEEIELKLRPILKNVQFNKRYFAFGILDEKLGQKLILVLESKPNKEIYKPNIFVDLPKFERPKEVYFVEKFIETPTGKIDKNNTVNEHILNKISNG